MASAVGKRIRRDIDDAHDFRQRQVNRKTRGLPDHECNAKMPKTPTQSAGEEERQRPLATDQPTDLIDHQPRTSMKNGAQGPAGTAFTRSAFKQP